MQVKMSQLLALCLASALSLSACHAKEPATAAQSGPAIATVNGVQIPQSRFNVFLQQATAQGQPDTPALRNAITNELIARELLSQQATKEGLERQSAVAAQLAIAHDTVLASAYIQGYLKSHPVTEPEIQAAYAKLSPELQEYKARHILVKTKSQAEAIIAKLNHGANFAKLAEADSIDTGSKKAGGELGWVSPGNVVPQFAAALPELKPGTYTKTPVQSPFGWHIIMLEGKRTRPLDQVKPQIVQMLQREQVQRQVSALRAGAKIVVHQPAPAPAPTH